MKIRIFQINPERDEDHVIFLPYDDMVEVTGRDTPNPDIYDLVFYGDIKYNSDTILNKRVLDVLDDIYARFQHKRIEGFEDGRKLNISDIIWLEPFSDHYYYIDDGASGSDGFVDVNFKTGKTDNDIEGKANPDDLVEEIYNKNNKDMENTEMEIRKRPSRPVYDNLEGYNDRDIRRDYAEADDTFDPEFFGEVASYIDLDDNADFTRNDDEDIGFRRPDLRKVDYDAVDDTYERTWEDEDEEMIEDDECEDGRCEGCLEATANNVMAAYQNANKWLDSVKEAIYTKMNCPFFSSFVHELAHTMPERFDKFGEILHSVNMEIPYPATPEITRKPANINEAFDIIFKSLDDIKAKLNAFIKCTEEGQHGLACAAEDCLNDIESEYSMLYRLQAKAKECGDDTISFDKFVGQYVEHKGELKEALDPDDQQLNEMRYSCDFSKYEPWGGAINTYNKIKDAGKLDELEALLDELYPNKIIEDGKLNDILWFDSDWIYKNLGMEYDEDGLDEDGLYESFEGDEFDLDISPSTERFIDRLRDYYAPDDIAYDIYERFDDDVCNRLRNGAKVRKWLEDHADLEADEFVNRLGGLIKCDKMVQGILTRLFDNIPAAEYDDDYESAEDYDHDDARYNKQSQTAFNRINKQVPELNDNDIDVFDSLSETMDRAANEYIDEDLNLDEQKDEEEDKDDDAETLDDFVDEPEEGNDEVVEDEVAEDDIDDVEAEDDLPFDEESDDDDFEEGDGLTDDDLAPIKVAEFIELATDTKFVIVDGDDETEEFAGEDFAGNEDLAKYADMEIEKYDLDEDNDLIKVFVDNDIVPEKKEDEEIPEAVITNDTQPIKQKETLKESDSYSIDALDYVDEQEAGYVIDPYSFHRANTRLEKLAGLKNVSSLKTENKDTDGNPLYKEYVFTGAGVQSFDGEVIFPLYKSKQGVFGIGKKVGMKNLPDDATVSIFLRGRFGFAGSKNNAVKQKIEKYKNDLPSINATKDNLDKHLKFINPLTKSVVKFNIADIGSETFKIFVGMNEAEDFQQIPNSEKWKYGLAWYELKIPASKIKEYDARNNVDELIVGVIESQIDDQIRDTYDRLLDNGQKPYQDAKSQAGQKRVK